MGHIREAVYLNAPVERVWAFVTDYARFPEWQTSLIEVRDFQGLPGTLGFSYEAVYKGLGRRLEGRFEITEADRPRLLKEKGEMPGIGVVSTATTLEPVPEGGTTVTFVMDYEMGTSFAAGLADRLIFERSIERDIRHSNENLKALIEAEVPVPVG